MGDAFDPNRETRAEYDDRILREIGLDWDAIDNDTSGDDWDEPCGSCDWCGGTGWVRLNGQMMAEYSECGGYGSN